MSEVGTEVRSIERLSDKLLSGALSRRGFLTVASSFSVTALLASCGTTEEKDGVVPFYTTESDPESLAFYKMVIAQFKKEHPGADVKLALFQDENQLQFLQTAFQTRTDVGIFVPPASQVPEWARAGYLLPLTDLVEEIGRSEFLDGSRIVVDRDDYAIPVQANASAVYYRKDVLDAAGIEQPTTYDDYLAAIRELHGKDGMVGIASSLGTTPQLPLQFFAPYVYQSGWDYFDRDGSLLFDHEDVLGGIKRYIDVMRNTTQGFYNADFGKIVETYLAGKAVFATFPGRLGVNAQRQAPKIAEKTGVMGIPAGPFMSAKLHFGGNAHYAMFSRTKERALAKDFLRTLIDSDNALSFALTVPGHLLPSVRSVQQKLRKAVKTSDDPYLKAHGDWVLTFLDLVPGAMNPGLAMGSVRDHEFTKPLSNPCPWGSEIWSSPPLDGAMLQNILITDIPAEQAWTEATARMRDMEKTWKDDNPTWRPPV